MTPEQIAAWAREAGFAEPANWPYIWAASERDLQAFAALAFAAGQPKWQPIETAPRDGTRILISDGKVVDVAYWDYEAWCAPHSSANSVGFAPTLWTPLLEPLK